MAENLTLVVTCTDRKSSRPRDHLRFENLPRGSWPERAARWRAALATEPLRKPLRQLYQGESWTEVLKLEESVRRAGFEPTLLVASAGLGLVGADESWPSYAATFSPRHADTIGRTAIENRSWWGLITEEQRSLRELTRGQTVLVLSEAYSQAMAPDLSALGGREDVVVFGGSKEIPDDVRIPADRNLRFALGGTSGSLNLRTAKAWIENLDSPSVVGRRNDPRWLTRVEEMRKPEVYDRTPLKDAEVIDFVLQMRRRYGRLSKTRALRLLRDSGLACEQKRFGGLFDAAVGREG